MPALAPPGITSAPRALPPNGRYRVALTRLTRNIYRDTGSRLVFVTRYCYEYVYGDTAVLLSGGNSGVSTLIFSNGNECDVEGAYRPNASMERLGDDVYEDRNSNLVYRTSGCGAYAYGEDAVILDDRIIFIDSREVCDWY